MKNKNVPRFIFSLFVTFVTFSFLNGQGIIPIPEGRNLAIVAAPSGSYRNNAFITSLNDCLIPEKTGPIRTQGNRPAQRLTSQWVQYDWIQPVTTKEIRVFWWNYENSAKLPQSYKLKYWDGIEFVPVKNVSGLGLENMLFNISRFDPVKTIKLRLELDSVERFTGTLLEWMVFQDENSPDIPPFVTAGGDRSVMTGGKTYLAGVKFQVRAM
jgi:hypothetical protein